MIFVHETKVELKHDKETVFVAEIKYDDIEDVIECAYGLWRALVMKEVKKDEL